MHTGQPQQHTGPGDRREPVAPTGRFGAHRPPPLGLSAGSVDCLDRCPAEDADDACPPCATVATDADAVLAVKKVGPQAFHLIEASGEYGAESVQLMARYGDDAVWIVARKNRLAIFVKYGDTAGEAMMKHGEIAEPLLESAGKSAAGAFQSVSPQNGRRLGPASRRSSRPRASTRRHPPGHQAVEPHPRRRPTHLAD